MLLSVDRETAWACWGWTPWRGRPTQCCARGEPEGEGLDVVLGAGVEESSDEGVQVAAPGRSCVHGEEDGDRVGPANESAAASAGAKVSTILTMGQSSLAGTPWVRWWPTFLRRACCRTRRRTHRCLTHRRHGCAVGVGPVADRSAGWACLR